MYTVELLRRWKVEAEDRAARMLARGVEVVPEQLRLALPELSQDDAILSYASTAVECVGRSKELSELRMFLADSAPFAWWLWTGSAGAGKSRLALELCREIAGVWNAGFLRQPDESRVLEVEYATDTLVVVDYAAQRAGWLSDVLLALTERVAKAKVRVLVLERDASGPWLDTVLRRHRLEESYQVGDSAFGLPRILTGLADDEMRAIIQSLARIVGDVQVSRSEVEEILDHARGIDSHHSPLFTYVATLDWLNGQGVSAGRDAALRRLISRADAALTHRIYASGEAIRARNCRTFATILGGCDIDVYRAVSESPTVPVGLLPSAFENLWPASLGELLDGLRPDMLGELYVLDQLGGVRTESIVASELIRLAWTYAPNSYAAFVTRALDDHVGHERVGDLLRIVEDVGDFDAWANMAADAIVLLPTLDHPLTSWILERLDQANERAHGRLGEVTAKARFRAINLIMESDPSRANRLYTALLDETDADWHVRWSILNNRGITWSHLSDREAAMRDYSAVVDAPMASDEIRACALNNRADLQLDPRSSIADRTSVLALAETTYNRRYIALVRRARSLHAIGEKQRALTDIDTILSTDDIAQEQKMAARLQRAEWLAVTERDRARSDLDEIVTSRRNFSDVEARARALLADLDRSRGV